MIDQLEASLLTLKHNHEERVMRILVITTVSRKQFQKESVLNVDKTKWEDL